MRIELHHTDRVIGGGSPALDHDRLANTVNALQTQLSGNSFETLISRNDFNNLGTWNATNGSVAASGGFMTITQSGSSLVSASSGQTVNTGTTNMFRSSVKGDASSAGKFVQIGIFDGGSFTQLSLPVQLTTSFQEIAAIVPTVASSSTIYINGFDTVSGNNIIVDYAEVLAINAPVVNASGRDVLKNGMAMRWRGVNHSNIPIGYDYNHYFWQEPKQSRYDLQDMATAGFTSTKVYGDTYDRQGYGAFLDECYRNGIDVFLYHYVPTNTDYTSATGSANRTAQINAYTSMVTTAMYHPCIVGYGFGNEMNFGFNLGTTTQLSDWYSLLDAATAAAKAVDPNRVYTTANGDIGTIQQYDSAVPHLDIWGATIYRGTSFGGLEIDIQAYTAKPFLVAEYGYDRYNHSIPGEDQTGQAQRDISLTKELDVMRSVCARFVFEWADEWWKENLSGDSLTTHDHVGSQNYNDDRDRTYDEEWFGMTYALNTGSAQPRTKTMTYTALQQYQLATPLFSPTLPVETVAHVMGSPSGFIMHDTFYVPYRVNMSTSGILTVNPLFILNPDNAATPILHLDAAHVTTTVSGGYTYVNTWLDQSGNLVPFGTVKNATQYNQSNQPWIVAGPSTYNALRFNGTGQFMELFNLPYGNNVTIFIVAANQRPTLGTGVDTILANIPTGGTTGGVAINTYSQYGVSGRALQADNGGGSYDGVNVTTVTLYVDGTTPPTALSLGVFKVLTYQGTNIMARNYTRFGLYTDGNFDGINDISEVIIYQGAMTNTQRSAVETSLMTKYGI